MSASKTPRAVAIRHVERKFADLRGVKPSMQRAGPNRIYTFSGKSDSSGGGPSIRQVVRVTIDPEGKILKVVASR